MSKEIYFNSQCDSVLQTISVVHNVNDRREAEATRADKVITPQDREFREKLENFYVFLIKGYKKSVLIDRYAN